MREEKDIEKLFDRLSGTFNTHETPEGHQRRFLDRLNSQHTVQKKQTQPYWQWAGVAAAIALLFLVGASIVSPHKTVAADLASVSPFLHP